MVEESIYKILNEFAGEDCGYMIEIDGKSPQDEIKKMLDSKNTTYKLRVDEMYESCGYDVWSLSITYIEDGELKLFVEQLVRY